MSFLNFSLSLLRFLIPPDNAANMKRPFRNDPRSVTQDVDQSCLILCMKMIQNLIVDYVFHFVIDCDFSHLSSQLLKLFN